MSKRSIDKFTGWNSDERKRQNHQYDALIVRLVVLRCVGTRGIQEHINEDVRSFVGGNK